MKKQRTKEQQLEKLFRLLEMYTIDAHECRKMAVISTDTDFLHGTNKLYWKKSKWIKEAAKCDAGLEAVKNEIRKMLNTEAQSSS